VGGKKADGMIEPRDFARQLRSEPTDAERILWRQLRQRQLHGHKFRRQHVVGGYIVDFACVERKLAVELDGSQHAQRTDYDAARTRALAAQGYRVLRFWNNDVFGGMDGVLAVILAALDVPQSPHPDPPPAGGGRG